MTSPEDAFSTLDDFLLSLADGVAHAQGELARAGALGPPGRQFVYHLPRVDFELKMNLRVVGDTTLSHRYSQLRPNRASDKHLLFKPLATDEASSTLEVAAVVRGAFVAVPENGGLPAVLLSTDVNTTHPLAPVLQVGVRNAAGEAMSGMDVQVNVDREESAALTQSAGMTFVLASGTGFEKGVVSTDALGAARVTLNIDPAQQPCLLALVVDAGGRTDTLIYEVVKT
jgi:hypothetical protein